MADPKYVDAFVGLKPNKDWHETHFDLEPVMYAYLRLVWIEAFTCAILVSNVITKFHNQIVAWRAAFRL
jgi:hypothetical protein